MPTYQYACTACHERLEAVQSFSDPALTECPACSGRLRKVFSAVGVVFKGSGFYKNDSRAGNGSADKGGDKAGDKSGDKAAATTADKGSSDKGAGKGSSTPAPAAASSSSSTPAAKSA